MSPLLRVFWVVLGMVISGVIFDYSMLLIIPTTLGFIAYPCLDAIIRELVAEEKSWLKPAYTSYKLNFGGY